MYHPDVYPMLFNPRYSFKMPCITTNAEEAWMKVLTSAKSHGESSVKIPKNICLTFGEKILNISKYLKPDDSKALNPLEHLEFKLVEILGMNLLQLPK